MNITMNIIDQHHQRHYWYGGEVATIKYYKGYTFHIEAIGDVRCWLMEEDNHELAYVKDKGNNGAFYGEMRNYIKDDAELIKYIRSGRLVVDNNNWWECSMTDIHGWHDLGWVLDADLITEAIDEVLDALDAVISDFENGYLDG